jgi:prevent-host-death family protein
MAVVRGSIGGHSAAESGPPEYAIVVSEPDPANPPLSVVEFALDREVDRLVRRGSGCFRGPAAVPSRPLFTRGSGGSKAYAVLPEVGRLIKPGRPDWATHGLRCGVDRPRLTLTLCPGVPQIATVNISDARAQLSNLVDQAAAGKDVIIARGGKPVARLTGLSARKQTLQFGLLKGKIKVAADFDVPLPDGALAEFEDR